MRIARTFLTLTLMLTAGGSAAWADLGCVQNTVTTTILRSEGVTELLPDISLTCTGAPAGGSVTFNFTVNVNAPITSKTDGTSNTEAVLNWSGSASGRSVGVLTGNYALSFQNVTFLPADATSGFTLTLSGIRVNASTLSQSAGFANGVSVQIIATPAGVASPLFGASGLVLNVSNVAYALPSLSVSERVKSNDTLAPGKVSLSQCESRAWSADDPGAPSFYVTLAETFSNGFRTMVQEDTNPAIPTNATRFRLTFGNIPGNVQLYIPNALSTGSLPAAVLISGANAEGSGGAQVTAAGYTQVNAGGSNGGAVVYEITAASSAINESLDVPVWVAFASGQQPPLTSSASPVTVAGTYAPISNTPGAASGPIPRFTMVPQLTSGIFVIAPCQTSLLYPYVQTANGWNTGVAVSNTGSDPFGTVGQSNSCTFYFYGGTPSPTNPVPAPATIAPFPTPVIPPGSTWANVASNMGAVNFQGYAIAQCNFRYAHGYAFVAGSISTSYVAQSYLALVLDGGDLPKPRTTNPAERLTN